MNIFSKNKNYRFQEIVDICDKNKLTTVDCLKDENIISIEDWDDKAKELGGESLFEFKRTGEDNFLLKWAEFNN